MAEKTVRLPDSRDVNRSWRRISTGRLSFLYSEEKILPNYLKSTTGSCHDVCKYGRKHEESEKKPRVSPLKRVSRSFSGTLNLDSPLRKKKALTKSTLNPSSVVGSDHHAKSQVGNSSSGACKKMKAERREKKAVSLSETRLVDSTKRKKKTVSQSFKTFGVSLGRAYSRSKEMVEHNRHVTALKLKSVAQTAAIALRRSTRKKTNGGSKTTEPKKTSVSTRASMSPKRCSRCLKAKKDSSSMTVPLSKTRKHVDEKCSDLVEEKTLYVIKMETGNEIVESDQNQPCVMDSPIDDRKSEKSQEESECIIRTQQGKEKANPSQQNPP
ncbi:unnamed protein product [Arabis nemorensis]|uniref:Calmodulin-binding domain-containing protein n=1 Tax=Arabis nemorensis TaxID=586526 RepID=A0A565CM21_9BRAS|nr:unnamed protein product [Arabis nemorensis]